MEENKHLMRPVHTLIASILIVLVVASGFVYVFAKKGVTDRYGADAANNKKLDSEIPGICYSGEMVVSVDINNGENVNGINFGIKSLDPNLTYSSYESTLPGWVNAVNPVSASEIKYVSGSSNSLSLGTKNIANITYTFNGIKEYPSENMFVMSAGETYISDEEGSDLSAEGRYLSLRVPGKSEIVVDQSPCIGQKLNTRSNGSLSKNKDREIGQNNLDSDQIYGGESRYACYNSSVRGDIAPAGSPDGLVNVGDVTSVLRIVVGLDTQPDNLCCVDVAPRGPTPEGDGDGRVNVGDVIRVLRASVGLENLGTCDNPGGVEEGILSVELSNRTPVNHMGIVGGDASKNAIFRAVAIDEEFVITDLRIKVPADSSTSVESLTIKYNDSSGATRTQERPLTIGTESYAQFNNLDLYVPADNSVDFDIWVKIPEFVDGAETGDIIISTLDHDSGFGAVGLASSNIRNSIGDSDIDSNQFSGRGETHVRGTYPAIISLANSGSPSTSRPIYRFNVTANPYDDVEIKKITFDVLSDGVDLSDFRLRNAITGEDINTEVVPTVNADGQVEIWVGTQDDEEVEIIAAGNRIEYGLFAVVQGWSSGDILGVGINEEYTPAGPDSVSSISNSSLIWSDRSAIPHSVNSGDWFNGYLVEDLPSTTIW